MPGITGGSGGQWTELPGFPAGGASGSTTAVTVWQKIAADGDSGATFTVSYVVGNQKAVQWIVRVSDTGGTPTVGASSGKTASAATSLTSNQITIASGSQVLAVFTGRDASTAVTYTAGTWTGTATGLTGTERDDQSNTGSSQVSAELQDGAATATGAGTVTAASTSSASQAYSAGIVELVPVTTSTITYGTASLINSGAPSGTVTAPTCNAGDLLLLVIGYGGGSPVVAPGAQPPLPHAGGQTWRRLFRHRQALPLPAAAAAVSAAPFVPQLLPPPRPRPPGPGRARLGGLSTAAAGILAVTPLSPQPVSVPPAHPAPVIQHAPPHRATGKGILAPPRVARLTAKLPPAAVSPRPPRRGQWRGVLAKTTLSAQPPIVSVLPQPVPVRRPGPHRAQWRGVTGPAPVAVAVTTVPPARPRPVTNRPPAPHRATGKGILAATTLAAQPSRVAGPQWRQPNAPRPAHRAAWRAIAGPAPAVLAPAVAAPARSAPVTNRPPPPHRAITRRVLAPPAPLAPPARPRPTINRPPPPHRAVTRAVAAKTTLAAQPSRVAGPQWRQPNAPRPAHRAIWRAVTGAAPPPPPFSIGALNASDRPTATQAPADSLGPSGGTLTATDQRTGGPG